MDDTERVQVPVRLAVPVHRQLVARAEAEGRSLQVVLERFAREYGEGRLPFPATEPGATA